MRKHAWILVVAIVYIVLSLPIWVVSLLLLKALPLWITALITAASQGLTASICWTHVSAPISGERHVGSGFGNAALLLIIVTVANSIGYSWNGPVDHPWLIFALTAVSYASGYLGYVAFRIVQGWRALN
jgi:hypothetical protein